MKKLNTHTMVLVSFFAALTMVGTMIKIPIPTGSFVHLGNTVLILSVLFLGYFHGILASIIGFIIFDILNGYLLEIPYFILETFIVGTTTHVLFLFFKKNPNNIFEISIISIGSGIIKLFMTFLKNLSIQLILDNTLGSSMFLAIMRLPATFINILFTVIIVSLVYFPLKNSLR